MSLESAVLSESVPVIIGPRSLGEDGVVDPLAGIRLLPSERREYDGLRKRGCSHQDAMAKIERYLFHPPH